MMTLLGIRMPRGGRPAMAALLAATLAASTARADTDCFPASLTVDEALTKLEGGGAAAAQYLLGLDRLLTPVKIRFFPDGRVCGASREPPVRFYGRNVVDGEIRVTFLAPPRATPAEAVDPAQATDPETDKAFRDYEKERRRQERYRAKLFGANLSGSARKETTEDSIIWDGRLRSDDGKEYDFYLKRTRSTAKKPPPVTTEPCGEGGCEPLQIMIAVRKGSESRLRRDVQGMPITKVKPIEHCYFYDPKKDEVCFSAHTWPFEEGNVVQTLRRKDYVRHATRWGIGAGGDSETLVLESNKLLSANLRLNVPVVVPMFQQAITRYFEGTGLSVGEPAARQNSLIWEFKGRRFQFEKKSNPSPAERSEWWKVRLQIAITEMNPGAYVLLIGMPETRVFSWALPAVPNDEKFTTELTNDERFLDLQGRLIVAITRLVAAQKDMP